jgi:hypothetical protein
MKTIAIILFLCLGTTTFNPALFCLIYPAGYTQAVRSQESGVSRLACHHWQGTRSVSEAKKDCQPVKEVLTCAHDVDLELPPPPVPFPNGSGGNYAYGTAQTDSAFFMS